MMTEKQIDALAEKSAGIAMRAAALYVQNNHPSRVSDTALVAALIAALKAELPGALDEALRDAREAYGAGMCAVAEVTFGASIAAAGVRAARMVCEG